MKEKTLWYELNDKRGTLYQQGQYSEVTKRAEEALRVAEKTFGSDHSNVATSLYSWGTKNDGL
ncbi:MAG: tetratricopeptide repeat protein [Methanomicrobia archaeon]|nr:tetratricopeptide repeat protein [Methanomicrobia archaeon]